MKVKFVWYPLKRQFVELTSLDSSISLKDILTHFQGYTEEQQSARQVFTNFSSNKCHIFLLKCRELYDFFKSKSIAAIQTDNWKTS